MADTHVAINRDLWNAEAEDWVAIGERLWKANPPVWGNWGLSETDLHLLPASLEGKDTIELGCGTGYVSGWLARRGARATGMDISSRQLETAVRLAKVHRADITFIEGNAEATGLRDDTFDFAISEYGAAIWCKPEKWLREAWRLLRAGGDLVFLGNHPLALVCSPKNGAPCDTTLHRPYRNMWGADWTNVEFEPSGICFNLTVSAWFGLFREIGFVVEGFQELYAPQTAEGTRAAVPATWAREYPVEQVWHLRKPG